MTFTCPHCTHRMQIPAGVGGVKVRCPRCQTACRLPAVPAPASTMPLAPAIVVHQNMTHVAPANGFGTASLVVAVLSFLVCWVPFLGVTVSGIGLLLGLVGIVSGVRHGSSTGTAVGGALLSAISMLIGLVIGLAIIGATGSH